MRPKRIVFSKEALADLEHIYRYIAERDPRAAANVVTSIRDSISYLAEHPRLGAKQRDGHGRLLIEPRYKFVVSYNVTLDTIEIRYIFHPGQDR